MLNPDYLEHITDELMRDHIEKAVDDIITDAARRIAKTGTITETASWQVQKLEQLGAYHDYVLEKLSKAVNMSQDDLLKLFNDVTVETIREDDKIYRAAGYDPVPLKDNSFMQRLIWSSVERTNGTLENLTRTTANTATRQFERILDQAHFRLASGAFSFQDVVRWGIKDLAKNGIASIEYPSGHVDYTEVAFRRATLTGLNQAGLAVQERRAEEMGCDYVETTAHAGARPSHAVWQGRVFKLHGSEPDYPNFYDETGYGTGEGLGGWNCRHGFYPFFPGLSELANTKEYLDELNNATVTYNGKKMSMYDATQEQRRIERNIRRWKREYKALSENGQDATEAAVKLRSWRERETDFLKQTELPRQGSREQVFGFGRSESASATWAAKKAIADSSGNS
jgi:AraC-like DNA-binding protein